jgi:mRNA interferase MazF
MEKFVKGSVVVIPFPFSDLSLAKRRPALVLANLSGADILLCQITSHYSAEKHVVSLKTTDFITGTLPVNSYIRPTRIFTADKNIILRTMGVASHEILTKTIDNIVSILKSN